MHPARRKILVEGKDVGGPVAYWMSRDQRVSDNWALHYAAGLAHERKVPLAVVFALAPGFLGATLRQYDFMLRGLEEVERTLAARKISFFLLPGSPPAEILTFVNRNRIGILVTDFSPLRPHLAWKANVARRVHIPFYEVDAHNIVPYDIVSNKREFSAATFRPKIHRLLSTFLEEDFVPPKTLPPWKGEVPHTEWNRLRGGLKVDTAVKPVDWLAPGEKKAQKILERFIGGGLERYAVGRNDPTQDAQSNLSPYLHFGQIAAQRVVQEVMGLVKPGEARDAFVEEIVVRRELSDNFCFHTPDYTSVDAFPAWARKSLDEHRGDQRLHLFTRAQFEHAATHDPLWNAAQMEMVHTGKMHGYMRMYWAKKILEWTPTPEQAMRTAIYLNDKYELDGRDPNGYAGIAWSIGGVHDRAWGERTVFGKIRYMSYDGCKRKFDVARYIKTIAGMK
jgi:deoxyribodipyrimidine photo-lyase